VIILKNLFDKADSGNTLHAPLFILCSGTEVQDPYSTLFLGFSPRMLLLLQLKTTHRIVANHTWVVH